MLSLLTILASVAIPSTESIVLVAIVGAVSAVATFFATRHKTNRTVAQKEIDSIILANKELRDFISGQLENLQSEYLILEKKVKEYESEIRALNKKIEEQAEIIQGYREGKEAAEMKAENLEREVECLRKKVQKLEHDHDNA